MDHTVRRGRGQSTIGKSMVGAEALTWAYFKAKEQW